MALVFLLQALSLAFVFVRFGQAFYRYLMALKMLSSTLHHRFMFLLKVDGVFWSALQLFPINLSGNTWH
jgi:hypothetical protein